MHRYLESEGECWCYCKGCGDHFILKRANCEWTHREMPSEISSKVSSCFTSSGSVIKLNTDCSEYRISWRLISERKSPSSAFILKHITDEHWDTQTETCLMHGAVESLDLMRSENVTKCVLGGHQHKGASKNRWAQTRARFAPLNLHQERRESCVQMHWRGRKNIIRSCIISLAVNSFCSAWKDKSSSWGCLLFLRDCLMVQLVNGLGFH